MSQNASCVQTLLYTDSPLSIAENVIGILTLIYAVIITLYFYTSQLADIEDDIHNFSHDLETETESITSTLRRLKDKFPNIPYKLRARLERTVKESKNLINNIITL